MLEDVRENMEKQLEATRENMTERLETAKENMTGRIETTRGNMAERIETARENMAERLETARENMTERIQHSAPFEALQEARNDIYERFSKEFTRQQKRIMKSFPTLRSLQHDRGLKEMRAFLMREKTKKRQK